MIGDEKPVEAKVKDVGSSSNSGNSHGTTAKDSATTTAANDNKITTSKRHERLLVVYAPLLGNRVTVFLYDGAVFEGTLDSFETENEFALILRMATMMRPGREVIDPSIKAGVTFELMNIRFDDMAELKAAGNNSNNGGIGTDSAISKKRGDFGKERELHRWSPEESGETVPSLNSFNDNSTTQWDQFATNEKLFGLKTDFNEEIYTTKLDRNSANVRANEANAERIAKEIMMASTGGNVHLAEERGQRVEGNGFEDEEMLYGAVVRETKTALPPGFQESRESESHRLTTISNLNPAASEFKLNIDAPEFVPSAETVAKVTYYNQPRRNLNYHNGNGYYQNYSNAGYAGYYAVPNVPYYYIPPQAAETTAPTTNQSNGSSTMNPNAADFVMPQYYAPSSPQACYYHGNYQNNQQ